MTGKSSDSFEFYDRSLVVCDLIEWLCQIYTEFDLISKQSAGKVNQLAIFIK